MTFVNNICWLKCHISFSHKPTVVHLAPYFYSSSKILPNKSPLRKLHSFGAAAEPSVRSPTRRAIFLKNFSHYIENHRQQIVYLFIFICICVLLFSERFYSKLCVSQMFNYAAHEYLLIKIFCNKNQCIWFL